MGEAARQIRAAVPLPTIIFPEGSGSLTSGAHAVLFMSMLNSRNLGLVIRTQARAAPVVRRLGLEPIPMGYLVIAPGMRVGEVGEADLVGREEHERAQGYALAAEMLGMRFVYLEAGSGAPAPVPEAMVRAVRSVLTVPLVVGGGIRSGPEAARLLAAGAPGPGHRNDHGGGGDRVRGSDRSLRRSSMPGKVRPRRSGWRLRR
ncbi:geranylgeranylglyceryl phosphate synthase-like protein, partial [mine drainage metagenome]